MPIMTLLLRSFVFLLAFAVALPGQSAAGAWTGTIDIPSSALAVSIELRQQGDVWSGTIDIPQQGAQGLKLVAFTVVGPQVRFSIDKVPGKPTFDGKFDATGALLVGMFSQGGQEFPFTLSRNAESPGLVQKLAGFEAWLDDTRTMFDVPGCAVAIVRGGQVDTVFASGMRDVEQKLPVTADTLFAIGSSTKAFTTGALAMLADDGLLDWDGPVRKVIPEFALSDAAVGERLTVRDLVTHRSGMPRHDLVWYGATFERADMVRRLRYLPLNHDLRTDFQYNNLMFLCAGHVAERLTGKTWEEVVRARILQPLGMSRTNFRVTESQADADHAEPYGLDDTKVTKLPFRDISAVGPAGSINSSVREMARWVALHLGDGEVGGARLLSEASLQDLHRVRMTPGPSGRSPKELVEVGYALGWFVEVYRGHQRIQHGGNIDGFTALVAMLPDDDLGFVVLTNMDGTALPELVVRDLSDRALALPARDWRGEAQRERKAARAEAKKAKGATAQGRRTGTLPSHALQDYVGDYFHPGYGACKVTLQGDRLHVDFHGLCAAMQHWHYDVFQCVRDEPNGVLDDQLVQFTMDLDGEIDGLRSALEPNVPPIVFERQADQRLRDPEFLRTLAGDYEVAGQIATFVVQGTILVVTLPGQRHELQPGRGLVFALKGLTGYSVRFELDEQQRAVRAMFRQPDGVHEARRKA